MQLVQNLSSSFRSQDLFFNSQPARTNMEEEMMISTSTRSPPPWKHYQNPLYTPQEPIYNYSYTLSHCSNNLSDLSLIMEAATMLIEKELEEARAEIIELKAELEFEHRLRKKMECVTNRMAKELEEERRGREALERVCTELANRVSCHKADIDRIKREIEEERKMMKVADVLREERVQMKLADAKIFFEEKFFRLDHTDHNERKPIKIMAENIGVGGDGGGGVVSPVSVHRRPSPEPENPHIKRGIKGSVEFQRVVRALCSNKSNRQMCGSYKLECQKAQLKLLLKQRSSIQLNNLVMS